MSNADYLCNYTALTDQVVHLHGEFGTDEAYVTEHVAGKYGNPVTATVRAAMILTIWKEYLAMRFFVHADPKRYGPLIANAQHNFVGGIDKYPKTISKAYDMLVNYVSPTKFSTANDQDGGMSFYQEDNTRGGAGRGNGGGRSNSGGCGRGAGRGGCGSAHQLPGDNEDNHANVENHEQDQDDQDVGGATNNSTNNNTYFNASFNIYNVEQLVLMHGLPLMWLLIDSCSTTNIFANTSILSNIHNAANSSSLREQRGYLIVSIARGSCILGWRVKVMDHQTVLRITKLY
jgi:hypothetical protein